MELSGPLLLIVVTFTAFHLIIGSPDCESAIRHCPSFCKCSCPKYGECKGLKVDCSLQNLTAIPPSIPKITKCLKLPFNQLTTLPRRAFQGFTELKHLDLSFNKITEIHSNSFEGLSNLQKLKLHHNNLSLSNLSRNVFSELSKLEKLEIHENTPYPQNVHGYRDDIFENLTSLELLSLDGLPQGLPFSKGLCGLKSLSGLQLYGLFNYIANDTFAALNCLTLRKLNIESKRLYDIEPLAFAPLTNLKTLSLSFNLQLGFANASKSWYGLQFTNIETLYLIACNPIYNDVHGIIDEGFYRYLNNTKLKKLLLDRNDIIYIKNPQFHVHLPHLELLSLSHNRIQKYWAELMTDVYFLRNLKTVSISYQLRSLHYDPPEDSFENEFSEKIFSAWQRYSGALRNFYVPFTLPGNLETLLMVQGYRYEEPIFYNISVLGTKKLRYIDVSDNQVKSAIGPVRVQFPENMTWSSLKLGSNGMVHFDKDILVDSIRAGLTIEGLDLYDNKLGKQLSLDEHGLVFAPYKDLIRLNLSTNEIKYLPKDIFKNLINLETLNLSSNSLRKINFNFNHMTKLKKLDISSNLYSTLEKEEMDTLDQIAQNNNESQFWINLAGNPLMCTCETLEFLQWVQNTEVEFYDKENYVCAYETEFIPLPVFFEEHLSQMETKCSSQTYVIAAASSASTAFITIVISIFLYHHRWDIKFVLIRLIAQGRKQHAHLEERNKYQFDAFVAYHEDDKDWVRHKLLPNLENPPNGSIPETQDSASPCLHLCLHFRDFDGGTPITENIVEGITNSRKTILILSNSFVESHKAYHIPYPVSIFLFVYKRFGGTF